tara:strand:+ start:951 stop:1358 length:408 start_codon:yes stop_codon:yes gene_type:complete
MVLTEEERKERKRELQRKWNEKNKEYKQQKARDYYHNNKEHILEQKMEYSKTPAYRKSNLMCSWKHRGVKDVNDEMYNRYITTTKCDVCNNNFKSSRDKHLDHNHTTGEFRQVLCCSCNTKDKWIKLQQKETINS